MEYDPDIHQSEVIQDAIQHREFLSNWVKQRFPMVEDPDDVVQEAYLRLIRCCETGPVVNSRAFLFVTARNLALNRIRRIGCEKRNSLMPDAHFENSDTQVPSPHQVACGNEAVSILMDAIRTLPPRCRQIFTMRKIYGLSQREIAERLGISVNTVQVQGVEGLKKCRQYFHHKGILNENLT